MIRSMPLSSRLLSVLALAAAVSACDNPADSSNFEPQGRRIFAVDGAGNLVTFGSQNPDEARRVSISGLQAGETLAGIDFRPVDGRLYAVGSSSRIYTVDTLTAAATAVGTTPFTPALEIGRAHV